MTNRPKYVWVIESQARGSGPMAWIGVGDSLTRAQNFVDERYPIAGGDLPLVWHKWTSSEYRAVGDHYLFVIIRTELH